MFNLNKEKEMLKHLFEVLEVLIAVTLIFLLIVTIAFVIHESIILGAVFVCLLALLAICRCKD